MPKSLTKTKTKIIINTKVLLLKIRGSISNAICLPVLIGEGTWRGRGRGRGKGKEIFLYITTCVNNNIKRAALLNSCFIHATYIFLYIATCVNNNI